MMDSCISHVKNIEDDNASKIILENIKQNQQTTNSIAHSISSFLANTEFVAAHVEFCDSLVENGYKLEEAITITDNIFQILKEERTYSTKD